VAVGSVSGADVTGTNTIVVWGRDVGERWGSAIIHVFVTITAVYISYCCVQTMISQRLLGDAK